MNDSTVSEIHIAGIMNPATGYRGDIEVYTYSMDNRVRTNRNTASITTGPTFVAFAGTSTVEGTSWTSTIQTVFESTDMSHPTIDVTTGTALTTKVLIRYNPIHDIGYCRGTAIVCKIGGTTYQCS
jgi:hypothetical protein